MRYPSRHSRFGSFATNRPPDDLLNVKLVGRGGVEPPTSRLSGVRSNHLSYRPLRAWPQAPKTPKGPAPVQATSAGQLRQRATIRMAALSRMKGDRKSTRLNSSHQCAYRMPASAG